MCSHCLFPVVDKSVTSCHHLVTRLMRPTNSQQVYLTSLISSARNKLLTSWWQQARSNLLRTACISLVGTTYNKDRLYVTIINIRLHCYIYIPLEWGNLMRSLPCQPPQHEYAVCSTSVPSYPMNTRKVHSSTHCTPTNMNRELMLYRHLRFTKHYRAADGGQPAVIRVRK
jgi:hypothetical protein